MTKFSFCSKSQFLFASTNIAESLERSGYAIVKPWDSCAATLKEVAERFGRIQSHIRADANGLVGIATDTVVNRDWENFRSEYHGVSADEFLPHTDGSYLHGLVYNDGAYEHLLPPQMLLLQCVQPATSGGRNILIDGEAVRRDLAKARPDCLKILSTKGCVTYCRDDQIALDCAVFHELADGTIMLRYRYDNTAYVADWAIDAFNVLQDDYVANPKYMMPMALAESEILLVDNYRMLHGREAFTDEPTGRKRQMRRVWLAHDSLPVLRHAVGGHVERRALKRFQAYDILPAAETRVSVVLPQIGMGRSAMPQTSPQQWPLH